MMDEVTLGWLAWASFAVTIIAGMITVWQARIAANQAKNAKSAADAAREAASSLQKAFRSQERRINVGTAKRYIDLASDNWRADEGRVSIVYLRMAKSSLNKALELTHDNEGTKIFKRHNKAVLSMITAYENADPEADIFRDVNTYLRQLNYISDELDKMEIKDRYSYGVIEDE